jgi:hypothetical protein
MTDGNKKLDAIDKRLDASVFDRVDKTNSGTTNLRRKIVKA